MVTVAKYILSTEYLERRLGLCGNIMYVSTRFNEDGKQNIVLTTTPVSKTP